MQPRAREDVVPAVALVAATVALFWPVGGFDFLNFDDDVYVTANPEVRAGLTLRGLRWAFSSAQAGHFQPLTWLSHQADVSLFGLAAGAHHLTNLALHAVAVLACFIAWRRLLRDVPGGASSALLASVVFALHPLRLESVAWVSTRKDVLSGALFFLALIAWTRWVEAPSAGRKLNVLGLWLLALLAKPTVLPFPLLLLALDGWPLRRLSRETWRARVLEKAPLLALMAAFAAVAVVSQRSIGALSSLDAVPLPDRFGNASVALLAYVGRLFVPWPLSIFHPLRTLPPGLAVTALALGVASVAAALFARSLPAPLRVGWLWFVLLLLPVLGLVQLGGQLLADRWLYLPTSGLVAGLACCFRPLPRPALLALAALLFALTRVQLPAFQNSESVFRQALSVTPDNFMAHNNLAAALEERGATAEAVTHYEEAVRLNPTWPTALMNLGNARAREGAYAEASALYARALDRQPEFALAHYNCGLALARQGRVAEALPHYAKATQLRPQDEQAALGYGAALVRTGELARGTLELQRAVQLAPASAEARAQLARALRAQGALEEARKQVSVALSLDPAQPLALAELAQLP